MNGKWDKWYFYKASPKDAPESTIDTLVAEALAPIALMCFVCGLGVVVWQSYAFLRFGEWYPVSVISLLRWFDFNWARSPSDWIGVHRVLDEIPLLLPLLVLGIGTLFLCAWLDDKFGSNR